MRKGAGRERGGRTNREGMRGESEGREGRREGETRWISRGKNGGGEKG